VAVISIRHVDNTKIDGNFGNVSASDLFPKSRINENGGNGYGNALFCNVSSLSVLCACRISVQNR